MKSSILICLLFFVVGKINSQPVMIHPDTIDYGCIERYSDPDREFYIYNNGDSPLQIISCMGASGALVPTFSKDPISPGDSAIFKLTYNTQRLGVFNKSIKIKTNEDTTRVILAIGEVKMSTSTKDVAHLDSIAVLIFNDYIYLKTLNTSYAGDFECSILNIQGVLFQKNNVNFPSIIDLSNLPSGVYVLAIRNKNSKKYKRVVFFK